MQALEPEFDLIPSNQVKCRLEDGCDQGEALETRISFHPARFLDTAAELFPQEHADICKTAGTGLYLGVIAEVVPLD